MPGSVGCTLFCIFSRFFAILLRLEGHTIQARRPKGTAKRPLGRPGRVPEGSQDAKIGSKIVKKRFQKASQAEMCKFEARSWKDLKKEG